MDKAIMPTNKKWVFRFFNLLPNFIKTETLIKLSGQKIIYPFYHAVADKPLPHIRHLYQVKNAKQFREDLDILLKYFEPVELYEVLDYVQGKKPIRKNCFHLTFDDGLKSFYEIAAPILKEKAVPATCFLNTGFIDNKGLFFRYKASLLIEKLNTLHGERKEVEEILSKNQIPGKNIFEKIRNADYSQREVLDSIAKMLDFSFEKFLKEEQPYMTSAEIRNLIKDGFTFGAHSMDHPLYAELDLQDQLTQTKESINFVQQQFDLEYRCFSFPFTDHGVTANYFKQIQTELDISFGSAGLKQENIRNHLQRIPLESTNLSAINVIRSELQYYLLKRFFGKTTISR